MNSRPHDTADLLLAIEAEMRRIGLWEQQAPTPAALASTVPFCHDTLEFHQWLQWVFLPRMKLIVEQDSGWPSRCDIHPLAEHSFAGLHTDTAALLELIARFDRFINERCG